MDAFCLLFLLAVPVPECLVSRWVHHPTSSCPPPGDTGRTAALHMVCTPGTRTLEQKAAEALVGVNEEDLSLLGLLRHFGSVPLQLRHRPHMEEARLSSYSWSYLASSSIFGASMSVQLIIARVWVYDVGAFCTSFCYVDLVQRISSGSLDAWASSRWLQIMSNLANSDRYWIHPSVLVHFLWAFASSSFTCPSQLTGVTTKDWGLLPSFQSLCQWPYP